MQSPLVLYRRRACLTVEGLSKLLGVDKSTISRWENGAPPAERVLEIERATGVSRHDLRPDLYPRESPAPEAA